MDRLRILLLALIFALYHSVVAAQSVRTCCHDADCPVADCVQMGCLPAPAPLAGASVAPALPLAPAADVPAPPPSQYLPEPIESIWRPPE